jgi:hypothetical protein
LFPVFTIPQKSKFWYYAVEPEPAPSHSSEATAVNSESGIMKAEESDGDIARDRVSAYEDSLVSEMGDVEQ